MNLKLFTILSLILLSQEAFNNAYSEERALDSLGQVVSDVARAQAEDLPGNSPAREELQNGAQAASQVVAATSIPVRCLERSDSAPADSETPPGEEVPVNPPGRIGFFFDLQYMAIGNNGEMAMVSTMVPRINFNSAIGDYARDNGMTRAQVIALGPERLREILGESTSLTGQAKSDAVENALLIMNMSQLGSDEAILQAIGAQMQNVSFGRKVGLLASFLESFSDNYDDDRAGGGANSDGTVSLSNMMGAINSNLINGTSIDAGVCRDMHQAAVKLARAMGIPNAFGVGFAVEGGGHRTMVLTDPNNRNLVYQLNYGRISVNDGVAGATALSQNGTIPDSGIRFRIYSGEDRPVIILPSDRGGILNIVTGGNDRDLDPFYQNGASINQAGVSTPYGNFRLFYANATRGNGETVVGGAYNIRLDYNDVFYGEYGIAGFYANRPTEAGELASGGAYARITQGFDATLIRNDSVRISVNGQLQLRGMVAHTTVGDDSGTTFDYNISTRFGLAAEYATGPIRHTTALQAWSFFDQAHAIDASRGISFFTPSLLLTHRMETDLGAGVTGAATVGIGHRDLGTDSYWQYLANLSLDSTRTGTSLTVGSTGAISNDLPLWVPGSERVGNFSFDQNILDDRLRFNVTGQQSFETLNNNSLIFGLSGRF